MDSTQQQQLLPIITSIRDLTTFRQYLIDNPGVFIIKLGATWCGPCKQISLLVNEYMKCRRPNVQCANIDIDADPAIYNFLKSKRMVAGIPAILVYNKGNTHYVPDDIVVGADIKSIASLFARAYQSADC